MGIKFANSAFATLAAGINNSATSITLTTGQGARFPSLGAGDYFYATLIDASNNLEIVKCTARATDVLTVVRAQESTTARSFSTGDRIELRVTAAGLVDVAPVQSVNGATGAVIVTVSATAVSDQTNSSTGYFDIPSGTTAQRPGSPAVGMVRNNTTLGYPEVYDGTISGWRAFSGILYTHSFADETRNIALSGGATGAPISFTFTKRFAGSYLLVAGFTPYIGQNSYQAGEYMEIGGTRKYEVAHHVAPPGGAGDDGQAATIFWHGLWTDQTTTGSKTVTLGWSSRGGSTEQPGNYWNPENRSARARSRTTQIVIYEVDPATVASIT